MAHPVVRTRAGGLMAHPVVRLLLSLVVIQGSLFVSGILVVRSIGVEARGELALVSGLVGISSQAALMGLPAAVVYFVSSSDVPARQLLRRLVPGLVVRMLGFGLLGAIGLLVLGHLAQPLREPWVEATCVVTGVVAIVTGFTALAGVQGEQRYGALAVLQTLPIVVYAVATAALFLGGSQSIVEFLLANLAGWVAVPWLAWRTMRPVASAPGRHQAGAPATAYGDPAAGPDHAEVRRFALKSWIASAGPADSLALEQVLLGATLGDRALGLFVVAWAFETATVLPGNAMATFLAPRVAAAEPAHRRHLTIRWSVVALALATVGCLTLQLILAPLVTLTFGEQARPAVGPGRILLVAGVLLGLRRVLGAALQGSGRPYWSTGAELAATAVMAAGVPALGLAYGLEGACWAMLLAGATGVAVQTLMLLVGKDQK
jgi:O-antigen/teichoic acid export membrane protein